jgi:hypothetical protein
MKKAGKYIEPCPEFKEKFGRQPPSRKGSSLKMEDSEIEI